MIQLPTDNSETAVRSGGRWSLVRCDDAERPRPKAVLPGAFNPLHEGHRRMSQVAGEILGVPIHFELSITNVDKAPLDSEEVSRRVGQFAVDRTVWITCAPTFVEKSRLFPKAVFVTGADTIARIADVRYYDDSEVSRDKAIREIARQGCRFLVLGRRVERRFRTLSDLQLPPALKRICEEVPEGRFRVDISSTELRQQRRREV